MPSKRSDRIMKQILAIILFFATIFFIPSIYAQNITLPTGDFKPMRKTGVSKVMEVVNPLTVKLSDGRIIHLVGLDMPDIDYYDPGPYSVTAQEILTDFLKNRNVIIYQTKSKEKGRINRMGHHIAHLVRADDDIWVQGMLLSLGVARVRTTKYNPEMAKQMLALENKSRLTKEGLWRDQNYAVLSPEHAAHKLGSFQIVEGTINRVSRKRNKLYLNFGNNWRDDFTIGLSSSDLRYFPKDKREPHRWSGQQIRVRGWLRSYNGPFIEINHSESLELLFTPKTAEQPQAKSLEQIKNSGNALPNLNK